MGEARRSPVQPGREALDASVVPSAHTLRPSRLLLLLAAVCALLLATPASSLAAAGNEKSVCAYTSHSVAGLAAFSQMVHRDVNCAMVYNNAAPDWANWENPWFLRHVADADFAKWATAPGTARRLIITQDFFPRSLDHTDWRAPGAAGAYADHARTLATNLVAAGLGGAVIRLAHEANGTWYPHNIGTTAQDFAEWREFFRKTVQAMRSVPGANFQFDWCINAQERPIPLAQYYPGDDVVDIVGIDAYDSGTSTPAGPARWSTVYNRPAGIAEIVNFAKAHNKPMSIPEWGVSSPSTMQGAGDDANYVDGIADVVRRNRVSYQSYFYKYDWATQLAHGSGSLAAYIRHFSATGDSGPGSTAPAAQLQAAAATKAPPAVPSISRLRSTARVALGSLVRGGKLRRAGSTVVRWRSVVGGRACLVAFVSRRGVRAQTSRSLELRTKARCGRRGWAAGRNVVAAGSAPLIAGFRSPIALQRQARALRGLHPGRVRLTLVAVLLPPAGAAVVASTTRTVAVG